MVFISLPELHNAMSLSMISWVRIRFASPRFLGLESPYLLLADFRDSNPYAFPIQATVIICIMIHFKLNKIAKIVNMTLLMYKKLLQLIRVRYT